MKIAESDYKIEAVMQNLRQEFIEFCQDMLTGIDRLIGRMIRDERGEDAFLELRRQVHTIKGQGGTFGFPLISRIAHMLEDYIETHPDVNEDATNDIQAFIDRISDLLDQGEPSTEAEAKIFLDSLPNPHPVAFTEQTVKNLRALVVMPKGIQRKIICQELVSCGFRLSFASSAVSGLEAALAFPPHIVFVSMEISGFTGGELAAVFHSVRVLMDAKFILLTSYDLDDRRLADLPEDTKIIHKDTDFAKQLVNCLIEWGIFGELCRKAC